MEKSLLDLTARLSWLDILGLKHFIFSEVRKQQEKIETIHNRKLRSLGAGNLPTSCHPSDVIFNFSDYIYDI